jgi:hypothetical protein
MSESMILKIKKKENEMKNEIQEVSVYYTGSLDFSPKVNLKNIEKEIFEHRHINTERWNGIPDDYKIHSVDVDISDMNFFHHRDCDEDGIDEEILNHYVFEQVRDDLFDYVGSNNFVKDSFLFQPKKEQEVK